MKTIQSKFAITTILLAALVGPLAFGQSRTNQLQCRSKAKELAKTSYDQCMTIAKQDEAEGIRREYKAKLAKLKDFYEQKLRKLSAKKAATTGTTATASSAAPMGQTQAVAPIETAVNQADTGSVAPAFNDSGATASAAPAPATVAPAAVMPTEAPITEPVIRLKKDYTPSEPSERTDSEPELSI